MYTHKRPLSALPQAPAPGPHTPRRNAYAPSTPHAIRATQQRSGARSAQRTARRRIPERTSLPRPDSARGIFQRIAKLEAPVTKRRVVTPRPTGKENVAVDVDGNDEELGEEMPRPDFTLPIFEEDEAEHDGEPEDEEEAPIPSELPGGEFEYDPTATFKATDFAAKGGQGAETDRTRSPISVGSQSVRTDRTRTSRKSTAAFEDDDEDEDITMEVGRRAVSEAPMDQTSRLSFGSIRMSGFGTEPENNLTGHQKTKATSVDWDDGGTPMGADDDFELDGGGHTEDFRRQRRTSPDPDDEDFIFPSKAVPFDEEDDTFSAHFSRAQRNSIPQPRVLGDDPPADHGDSDQASDPEGVRPSDEGRKSASPAMESPEGTRDMTIIEAAVPRAPRRKRVKMARNGNVVPALPSSLVKRVAVDSMSRLSKRKAKIDRTSLKALEQATEWFFEQIGEDLEAYSNHARRKKRVDTSDVLTLMRRQRVVGRGESLQELAAEHLPPEVLAELELPDGV